MAQTSEEYMIPPKTGDFSTIKELEAAMPKAHEVKEPEAHDPKPKAVDLKKSNVVRVKVKAGKYLFEADGAHKAGDVFFVTLERAKQLAGDVDIVGES